MANYKIDKFWQAEMKRGVNELCVSQAYANEEPESMGIRRLIKCKAVQARECARLRFTWQLSWLCVCVCVCVCVSEKDER